MFTVHLSKNCTTVVHDAEVICMH